VPTSTPMWTPSPLPASAWGPRPSGRISLFDACRLAQHDPVGERADDQGQPRAHQDNRRDAQEGDRLRHGEPRADDRGRHAEARPGAQVIGPLSAAQTRKMPRSPNPARPSGPLHAANYSPEGSSPASILLRALATDGSHRRLGPTPHSHQIPIRPNKLRVPSPNMPPFAGKRMRALAASCAEA
jgi:hypothetical protein